MLEVLRDWDGLVEVPAEDAVDRIARLVDTGEIRLDRLVRASETEPPLSANGSAIYLLCSTPEIARVVRPARARQCATILRLSADPMAHFRDLNEFGPTLDAAAEHLGISPTAVEKDYWVSEVLRVLGRDLGGDFIFKGGTSLSKGFRIVERFSEDIDVLVLPGERGRGATDRLMKEMAKLWPAGSAAGVGGRRKRPVATALSRSPTPLLAGRPCSSEPTCFSKWVFGVDRTPTSLYRLAPYSVTC